MVKECVDCGRVIPEDEGYIQEHLRDPKTNGYLGFVVLCDNRRCTTPKDLVPYGKNDDRQTFA